MSRPERQELVCPQCGTKQPFTLWQSVNVTLDPGLKDRLLDGSLTQFKCGGCGHEANVAHPLLYHDMTKQLMIWLLPGDGIPEEAEFNPPGIVAKMAGGGYIYRIVRSRNELVEKIHVFDAGLDDRVIEYAKPVVRSRLVSDGEAADFALFFGGVSDDRDGAATIRFVMLKETGAAELGIPLKEWYADLERGVRERVGDDADSGPRWLLVDQDYIGALMGDP